jgi:AraC-like DNA-binding protein
LLFAMAAVRRAENFRIETGGPALRPRADWYGAGEAKCRSVVGRSLDSSYACFSIGVVVSGRFDYRSSIGAVTASPGTVLLGNAGEDFSYRYHDAHGVTRSVIALGHDLLAEVADACGRDATFASAALAPSRRSIRLYGAIRKLAAVESLQEDTAVEVVAAALAIGRPQRTRLDSASQKQNVLKVVRYLDHAFAEPITLDAMADMARLSRFHFIRAFRSLVGESPRQYLIAARMRAAADRLLDTPEPVSTVAFKVGFNDLSHFNATFRQSFGTTPREWRRAARF